MKIAIALSPLLLLGLSLPAARPQADEKKGAEFYEKKVRPILEARCYKCHSNQAKKVKGGFRIDNKEDALKGGESGDPAIVPGKPDKSILVPLIERKDEDAAMPPEEKDKLSAEEVKTVLEWIKLGAPGLKPKAEVDKKK